MTFELNYPPEIISVICAHVYAFGLPAQSALSTLDPLYSSEDELPTSLPSSMPPGSWPEPVSRKTLSSLCLINKSWYEAAKPWLWRRVEVRMPRSWLALVDEVADGEDEELNAEAAARAVDRSIEAAANAVIASRMPSVERHVSEEASLQLKQSIIESLGGPDPAIPIDLLSAPASREPSPKRLRTKSKSPARWKLMLSIGSAVQDVVQRSDPGMYVEAPSDPRPGRYVRHLDFNHFRTIGMRRSVEEGVNSRFVTGSRVEAVLKEMPNLTSFGATEYMDGALTLPVIKELFLRGSSIRVRGRPSRGRSLVVVDPNDAEEEDRERRRLCRELEAVDLTGCISAVFVNALTEFVTTHLLPNRDDSGSSDSEDEGRLERGRPKRKFQDEDDEPIVLNSLQRLGLRGVKSIQPHVLTPFVLSFPNLTHLDLSGTRAQPDLLEALTNSSTVRLTALALARCVRLTGESIKNFLIDASAAADLRELNLYGDMTFPSPLSADDMMAIVVYAPCFKSGLLTYVDLSSCPITTEILLACTEQPSLRSLGLSYIPDLPLPSVTSFVSQKTPNVEILTLVATSLELETGPRILPGNVVHRGSTRQASFALHTMLTQPLCTPPYSFGHFSGGGKKHPPPTRLRVIELSTTLLSGLGAGAGAWRIVRSKGGRGWYVDTASGWISGENGSELCRDLPPGHTLRREVDKLADANGNVSSGVGWHARKMEILLGHGMLGHEAGLYGAVSFAYQG